ncbi:MAG: NUDIX hydrolase [Solirubrobacteraceae bacterium]
MAPSVILRRLAYRLAYRVLQLVWFLTRPQKLGVKCVLRERDRILLVRHTYGSRAWDLPGGGVKRGEPPRSAARREMQEELGVDPPHWIELGTARGRHDHRHDTIHLFGAEVTAETLTINRAEIEVAGWFPRDQLPALGLLSAQLLPFLASEPGGSKADCGY